MSAVLSTIPVAQRRRLAIVLGVFAALFLAVGSVTATDASSAGLVAIAVVAFVVGALLTLVAWGMAVSVKHDDAEGRLDSAVEAALAAHGTSVTCGCGHVHDPDELHVVDAPPAEESCEQDGAGMSCTHDCAICLVRPTTDRTSSKR